MSILKKDELIAKDLQIKLLNTESSFTEVIQSERQLAGVYKVSRSTIRNSLQILINKQIISKSDARYIPNILIQDWDTLESRGIENVTKIQNKVISITHVIVDKALNPILRQPLGTNLTLVKYVRYIQPKNISKIITISLDKIFFPDGLISKNQLNQVKEKSILELSRSVGIYFSVEYQKIRLETINQKDSLLMQEPTNKTLIVRQSLFKTDKPDIFIYLISKKKPEFCKITQPNSVIQEKIGDINA